MEPVKRKYCLKKDKEEQKNKFPLKTYKVAHGVTLPPKVDLRSKCPSVYDQGQLGSCTANAIGAAYQFDEMKQNEKSVFIPSRLFIYFNERKMEGTIADDNGASIADGVESVHVIGVCKEKDWGYDISKFAECPPQKCYDSAKKHRSGRYNRLAQNSNQIKTALAQNSLVIFGITLYSSFESEQVARDGIVHMPKQGEKCLGGHAITLVGYDDSKQHFIARNSWGTGWGDKGYFYLPYAYVLDSNLASDFWVIVDVKDLE